MIEVFLRVAKAIGSAVLVLIHLLLRDLLVVLNLSHYIEKKSGSDKVKTRIVKVRQLVGRRGFTQTIGYYRVARFLDIALNLNIHHTKVDRKFLNQRLTII